MNDPSVLIQWPPLQRPGVSSHSFMSKTRLVNCVISNNSQFVLPMHTCIGAIVLNPSLQSHTKSPGVFLQTPLPQTLFVVMLHSSISAKYILSQLSFLLQTREILNTYAFHPAVIKIVSFVTFATVTTHCVFASSILA